MYHRDDTRFEREYKGQVLNHDSRERNGKIDDQNKTMGAVSARLNTEIKIRYKRTSMIEAMEVIENMLKGGKVDRGTRIEIGYNTKM